METKFEVSYVRDKKFAKEFFSYHLYKRPLGIIFTGICILAIASGMINVFAYKEYWAVSNILVGIFLFVFRAIYVKKRVKITLDRDKESNHGNALLVQNIVTENSIIVKSSINESGTEIEMSCIKKAYRSKNYIYLITKAKLAIVFDVNNFSKGTPEELIEFMSQKGIKVK